MKPIVMDTFVITNRWFGMDDQYGEWNGIMVKRVGCNWVSMEDSRPLYGKYEYR